ncbi:MAG TPA: hypothetical protein VFX05_04200 [Casimicrobiaceae bacterium]|nr:hypothetical protein [Casimicrobiaceae bacterium]
MFLAHFGVGFAAKAVAPRVSLGTLLFAAQFLDLLWPSLLQAGVEQVEIAPGGHPPLAFTHYPVSHSLAAVAAWSLALGGAHFALRRSLRAALVVAALVASHWALDLVVHAPDLPLWPGGGAPRVGLGLWSLPVVALALEFAVFAVGLRWYLRATRAVDRAGVYGLVALVALLVVIQLANVLGPPPPGVEAVAWAGQAQWLIVAWGWWIDRHRRVVHDAMRPATT